LLEWPFIVRSTWISPSIVCSVATASGRRPASTAAAAVTGPMHAIARLRKAPRRPSSATRPRTVDALVKSTVSMRPAPINRRMRAPSRADAGAVW